MELSRAGNTIVGSVEPLRRVWDVAFGDSASMEADPLCEAGCTMAPDFGLTSLPWRFPAQCHFRS